MKKIGVGISIALNVLLLVGLICVHFYDVSKCSSKEGKDNKEEKTPSTANTVVCTKTENKSDGMDTVDDLYSRNVLTYSNDGTLIDMKVGNVIKYKNKEDYQVTLDYSKENVEELGDLQLYFYESAEIKTKIDDGTTRDLWYKEVVESFENSGFKCQ